MIYVGGKLGIAPYIAPILQGALVSAETVYVEPFLGVLSNLVSNKVD